MVHSTVLIELKGEASQRLMYWPKPEGFNGPVDDIVQFAFSAKKEGVCVCVCVCVCMFIIMCVIFTVCCVYSSGVQMYILNTEEFGYLIPPYRDSTLEEAAEIFLTFKLKTLGEQHSIRCCEIH